METARYLVNLPLLRVSLSDSDCILPRSVPGLPITNDHPNTQKPQKLDQRNASCGKQNRVGANLPADKEAAELASRSLTPNILCTKYTVQNVP